MVIATDSQGLAGHSRSPAGRSCTLAGRWRDLVRRLHGLAARCRILASRCRILATRRRNVADRWRVLAGRPPVRGHHRRLRVANNAAALGITPAQVTDLTAQNTLFGYAYSGHLNAEAAYHASTDEKNLTMANLTSTIRSLAAQMQANPAVTDMQKENMGLPVHKTSRTPVPAPTTSPVIQRFDTATRASLTLDIVDHDTPNTRAKPEGVHSCEVRMTLGGTAPTDPAAMPLLANITRSPHMVEFDIPEVGQTAHFALRWLNSRGKPGPWSQFYQAVVPAG